VNYTEKNKKIKLVSFVKKWKMDCSDITETCCYGLLFTCQYPCWCIIVPFLWLSEKLASKPEKKRDPAVIGVRSETHRDFEVTN